MRNPRKKINQKLIVPLRTRTKGKANAPIHLTDLHEVAEAAVVAEVEIAMVTERTAVSVDVAEAEESEAVEDVEGAEVDSEDSITIMTMITVVVLAVVLVMMLAVMEDSVATVKTVVVNVEEAEDEEEDHHVANAIVATKKVTLCVSARNPLQRETIMPPHLMVLETPTLGASVVALVVDLVEALVVPKVMMEIDLLDVVDSGDVEEDEVAEVVEDHVNLTDEVEMIRVRRQEEDLVLPLKTRKRRQRRLMLKSFKMLKYCLVMKIRKMLRKKLLYR